MGKIKTYNDEKGFAFIAKCLGGIEVFGHKRKFAQSESRVGQPVSLVHEVTEKDGTAKKIREEENVPDVPLSDGGTLRPSRQFICQASLPSAELLS